MARHLIFVSALSFQKQKLIFFPVGDFAVFWMLVFILPERFQKIVKNVTVL